jgi:transposase
MLKMPQQQYIKYLREIEGLTINEIADILKIDWRTAKKYADKDDWNLAITPRYKKCPVMEPFKEIVETWLIEDSHIPRKQRHTATQIYQRLVKEYGFTGSLRTVNEHVRRKRRDLELERAKSFERLEHPGGEAQVDFCTIQVSKDSKFMEYKLLVMSFPYSNAAFVYPVPAENQECFLEGLKAILNEAGGVPKRIWFDNLSAAVVSIEKDGNRRLTDSFSRFCAHYRFEAVFCNAARGNEKGHVENKCGYSRRNWCVPIPQFTSHEQLTNDLRQCAKNDMERPHYVKNQTIAELWEEEKTKLNSLPVYTFEVFRIDSVVINAYGEIRYDGLNIPVFHTTPGSEANIKVYWDRIEVFNISHKLLTTVPRPYTGKTADIPWSEVFKGLSRKPRSVRHSQFVNMLPDRIKEFVRTEDMNLRKEHLQAMTSWCGVYEIGKILEAFEKLNGNANVSTISSILPLIAKRQDTATKTFEESYTPQLIKSITPNLSIYDHLAKGGER